MLIAFLLLAIEWELSIFVNLPSNVLVGGFYRNRGRHRSFGGDAFFRICHSVA
jgi:hypothetical protein